jgi:hypothetical protein
VSYALGDIAIHQLASEKAELLRKVNLAGNCTAQRDNRRYADEREKDAATHLARGCRIPGRIQY